MSDARPPPRHRRTGLFSSDPVQFDRRERRLSVHNEGITVNTTSFHGRTAVMSGGGSRGIGLAIARAIAGRGGNVVLLAKTDTPPDLDCPGRFIPPSQN